MESEGPWRIIALRWAYIPCILICMYIINIYIYIYIAFHKYHPQLDIKIRHISEALHANSLFFLDDPAGQFFQPFNFKQSLEDGHSLLSYQSFNYT